MGAVAAVGGAVKNLGGFRNELFGINEQADYAQYAAQAQQRALQGVTAEARAARDRMNLAAQSPQQLAALERGLSAAQTQVDTDLRQLAAIDPAIMEASKQVLGLLKGEQAAVNNPLMQQRQSQRQQLLNSLRSQYGPGAESTNIGQRALQQFDMESNTLFQQNQMGALSNAFNVATARPIGRGFEQLMATGQGFGNYQNRLLDAERLGSQNILAALGGEAGSAGAEFTRDIIRTGANRQFYEQMEDDARQIGRSWATMGMSSKGGSGSGVGGGGTGNSGSVGGYSLSRRGTTDANFWDRNPYAD